MKLLAVPVAVLGVLVACDGGGGPRPPGTKNDTGSGTELDTGGYETDPGTQVGSEGFWGCPIDRVHEVDGGTQIDAIGGTPSDLTSRLAGSWTLEILDEAAAEPIVGTLLLEDVGNYLWLDVADGAGCTDHLASEVRATAVRGTTTTALLGFVAIAPGAGRVLITADDPLEDVASSWGPPAYPASASASVTFRLAGDLDPVGFVGRASFVDCDPLDVVCATADDVATVTGAR